MESCENFKSPKQLGIKICTSDVSCYDGVALQCIQLPSNPDLNNVIESIDAEICNIKDLINNITVPAPVIPDDPWVILNDSSPEIIGFNYNGVNSTEVSKTLDVAYKVLSPSHLILKVKSLLDVNILDRDATIDFNFSLANIQNADSGWFSSGEKQLQTLLPDFTGESFGVPVSIIRVGGDVLQNDNEYDSKGRAAVSNGFVFCQRLAPLVNVGSHSFIVEWEIMCKLEDV